VPESELYVRGRRILKELDNPAGVSVVATKAYVGGGALPESDIPSVGILFDASFRPTQLTRQFRKSAPPIVGRIEDDSFVLDLKTVDPQDIPHLVSSIKKVLHTSG
jgi:L-seryl-tRNA(Ser) seleniumtransferase